MERFINWSCITRVNDQIHCSQIHGAVGPLAGAGRERAANTWLEQAGNASRQDEASAPQVPTCIGTHVRERAAATTALGTQEPSQQQCRSEPGTCPRAAALLPQPLGERRRLEGHLLLLLRS